MSAIKSSYGPVVANQINRALEIWQMCNPGTKPFAIVVGEKLRSQMELCSVLELRNGALYYGAHRILFAPPTDICMCVSAYPA